MVMKYSPEQWNQPPDMVTEAELGAAAAQFPTVKCVCPTCDGEQTVRDDFLKTKHPCHECEGLGFFTREMDSREEHYYILHLLKTRYQLR